MFLRRFVVKRRLSLFVFCHGSKHVQRSELHSHFPSCRSAAWPSNVSQSPSIFRSRVTFHCSVRCVSISNQTKPHIEPIPLQPSRFTRCFLREPCLCNSSCTRSLSHRRAASHACKLPEPSLHSPEMTPSTRAESQFPPLVEPHKPSSPSELS
ncbi:hypothetical protein IC582_025291 [Cucumis melo]